jgi:Rrf2 family protein
MRLITKNTDYAIRALIILAKNKKEFVSSRSIATKEGIPLAYLRRILHVLINEGIIISKEGVDGGVKLAKRPISIQTNDIIRMFQGEIKLSECLFRKKICPQRSGCALRIRIKKIEDKLKREFESISIAGLLREAGE